MTSVVVVRQLVDLEASTSAPRRLHGHRIRASYLETPLHQPQVTYTNFTLTFSHYSPSFGRKGKHEAV